MNTDIRISTGYPDHPKIRKLRKLLGGDGVLSHIFLLCYAGKYAYSGELKHMDASDIEEVARWRGEPGVLVGTLVELHLLDNKPGNYSIHNWQKWNKYAATYDIRSATARKNIAKRWEKRDEEFEKNK